MNESSRLNEFDSQPCEYINTIYLNQTSFSLMYRHVKNKRISKKSKIRYLEPTRTSCRFGFFQPFNYNYCLDIRQDICCLFVVQCARQNCLFYSVAAHVSYRLIIWREVLLQHHSVITFLVNNETFINLKQMHFIFN